MGVPLLILIGLVLLALVIGGPLVAVITLYDRSRTRLHIVLITGILLVLMGIGFILSDLDDLIFNFPLPLGVFNLIVWLFRRHHKHHQPHKSLTLNEEALEETEFYEIRQEANEQPPPPHEMPSHKLPKEATPHTASSQNPSPDVPANSTGLPLWILFGIGLGLVLLLFEFIVNEMHWTNSSTIIVWIVYFLILIAGYTLFIKTYIRRHLRHTNFLHLVFHIALASLVFTIFQNSLFIFDNLGLIDAQSLINSALRSYLINFSTGAALGYLLLPGHHFTFPKPMNHSEKNSQ